MSKRRVSALRRGPVGLEAAAREGGGGDRTTTLSRSAPAAVHVNHVQQRGAGEPHREGAAQADQQALPLRQRRIAQREQRHGRVGHHAADRARGDERRRMVDGEDDVDRAGRGRQRRDQRADERPAALDQHRGRDHDGRGHRHLERKLKPECGIECHGTVGLRQRRRSGRDRPDIDFSHKSAEAPCACASDEGGTHVEMALRLAVRRRAVRSPPPPTRRTIRPGPSPSSSPPRRAA